MNHQIENDVDIDSTRLKGRQTVTFDKERHLQFGARRLQSRIETLDMADLKPKILFLGDANELLSLLDR